MIFGPGLVVGSAAGSVLLQPEPQELGLRTGAPPVTRHVDDV